MQLGLMILPPLENQRRFKEKLCVCCYDSGHLLSTTANKAGSSQFGGTLISQTTTSLSPHCGFTCRAPLVTITLCTLASSINFGAGDVIIDSSIILQADIPVDSLPSPSCFAFDGRLLANVTHYTVHPTFTVR